jgi:hypothetical protein
MRKPFSYLVRGMSPFFYFHHTATACNGLMPAGNHRNIKGFGGRCIVNAFLFAIFMFSFSKGFTQSSFRTNTIYGEFGGNGVFLSLNYERQLGTKPGLGVHFGLGNADVDENFAVTIPVGVDYLFNISNQKSFIETGAGVTWALQNIWNNYKHNMPHQYKPGFIPSVSFRHNTPYGLMWKIGVIAVFSKHNIIPCYPGISLGWGF